MSILRNLGQCEMSVTNFDQPTALHVVIGFTCHLSRTASSTFARIFDEIRRCCSAKRDRNSTQVLMFIITDHLGEMYKEISSLSNTMQLESYPVGLTCDYRVFADIISLYSKISSLM